MDPEQFRALADLFPDPALLLARDGTVLAANRAVGGLGVDARRLVGRPLADSTTGPPDALADYLRLCARGREPVPGALELAADDGGRVRCRCYGSVIRPDPPGGENLLVLRLAGKESHPSQFALLNRQIDQLTEEIRRRKRAEAELRDQGDWLRVTLSSIGDAVITTDAAARVTFLNPIAEALTGWETAEAAGRPLEEVFRIVNEHTRRAVENPAERVLREDRIVGLANHTILIARDGSEACIDDSGAPIRNAEGRIAGVVLVFRDVTERKRSEEALRESERRFRDMAENIREVFWMSDPVKKVILYVSPAYEAIWGRSCESLYQQPFSFFEAIHPEDRERVRTDSLGRQARGEPSDVEYRVVRPDGGVRWVRDRSFPIKSEAGTRDRAVGVAGDVTDRKEAEAALRQSEGQLRRLTDALPALIAYVDADGRYRFVNERYEDWLGLTRAEIDGRPMAGLLGGVAYETVKEHAEAALAGREVTFEYPMPYRDGEVRYVRTTYVPHLAGTGRAEGFFILTTDVTQQRREQAAHRFLAEASAALADVVDHESTLRKLATLAVPFFADWCAVDMLTEDGTAHRLATAHVDPEMLRLADELYRRYPPDPAAPRGVANVLRTGEAEMMSEIPDAFLVEAARDEEHLRLMRDLKLRSYMCVPLEVRGKVLGAVTFVASESGRSYGDADLALARDLARRAGVAIENSRLYSELRESGRRKDEFLAVLAHELRNPLAPIRNGLHILKMPGADAAVTAQARDVMERQVQNMVRLVDDLLDLSRIMLGKIELRRQPVELAALIDRAVETARPAIDGRRHELELSLPGEPLWLDGDPVRLTQVIANLLTNAAKYTPPGGRVSLTGGQEGAEVTVRVRDNGIGIPAGFLAEIWEMFAQANRDDPDSEGGLGIGLSLVRKLVEMHGGRIEAHSEGAGRGSEFVVRLPALSGAGGEAAPGGSPDAHAADGRRILVVDDNVDAAQSLAMLLRLEGHEVTVAHDGISALRSAEADPPDVAFLDIGMPRMDGYELARRFRQHPALRGTVLIALTGWGQDEDRRRTREAGFDAHEVKPVEPETLQRLLTRPPPLGD